MVIVIFIGILLLVIGLILKMLSSGGRLMFLFMCWVRWSGFCCCLSKIID